MWRVLALAVAATLSCASAQLPIPKEPPGFSIGKGSADAKVQLETYIDLVRVVLCSLDTLMRSDGSTALVDVSCQ